MTDGTMTRRTALLGGTALGLAACTGNPESGNLWDLLGSSRLQFVNNNGEQISPNAIKRLVNGRPTTVSFQFAACGDICPITGAALSHVSESNPDVIHVIVAVDPIGDYASQNLHNIMLSHGLRTEGENANTIIIYPTSNGRADIIGFRGAFDKMAELQHHLGLYTEGVNPAQHSGVVSVFDGAGDPVGQVVNPYRIVDELPELLQTAAQRQTEESRAR